MYKYLISPPADWLAAIDMFLPEDFLDSIDQKLSEEKDTIFPPKHLIFQALEVTAFDQVTVVILGQDPYHGPLEACGLSFAVPQGVKFPPSLKNMEKELKDDLGQQLVSSELKEWAAQGVLLLNRTLTVKQDKPLSHKHIGWDVFTCAVLKALFASRKPIVFVTFGKESFNFLNQFKDKMGSNQKLLHFAHPSPLSAYRGFFKSKPFSQINNALVELGCSPIKFGR